MLSMGRQAKPSKTNEAAVPARPQTQAASSSRMAVRSASVMTLSHQEQGRRVRAWTLLLLCIHQTQQLGPQPLRHPQHQQHLRHQQHSPNQSQIQLQLRLLQPQQQPLLCPKSTRSPGRCW